MSLARGLIAQTEVVHAIILRETRTRFGAHQLGYLWALLEPVLMIGTFFTMFLIAGRAAPAGMDLAGFLATGIVPYMVFSGSVGRVAEAINGNRGLLFYPHVQPLDLAIARSLLEAGTYSAVFIVLMGANALYMRELHIDSALMVVAGFALASLLGTTLGLVFCSLSQYSNAVDRARGPLLRPFFWISGIFFAANQLPTTAQDLLAYNPLLTAVELVRTGWYPTYASEHAHVRYSLMCVLTLAFIGLTLERAVRRRIEVV
jgi:capsular polysaccharide transport system permease protein